MPLENIIVAFFVASREKVIFSSSLSIVTTLAGVSVCSAEQDFPLIYWDVFDMVGSPQIHAKNHFPAEQTRGFITVCSGGVLVPAHFARKLVALPRRCCAVRPVRRISRNLAKGAFSNFPVIPATGRGSCNLAKKIPPPFSKGGKEDCRQWGVNQSPAFTAVSMSLSF